MNSKHFFCIFLTSFFLLYYITLILIQVNNKNILVHPFSSACQIFSYTDHPNFAIAAQKQESLFTFTVYLETTFLQKGQKRPSQRIIEIGMYTPDKKFQRMVNPCSNYATGGEIIDSLNNMKQAPAASFLRFWTKLLIEKKALPSHLKRQNTLKQADAISKLLLRSDVAKCLYVLDDKYTPTQWLYALEEHHDKVNVARQYLDKYKANEKPKSLLFHTTKSVLTEALSFGEKYTWIAHNGKSFDMPILLYWGIVIGTIS